MKYIFFTVLIFIVTIDHLHSQKLEKPTKISIDLQSIGWAIATHEKSYPVVMYRINVEQMLTEKDAINFSHAFQEFTYNDGPEGTIELLSMWKRYIGKKGFYLGPYLDVSYMYRSGRAGSINTMYLGGGLMTGHVIKVSKDFFFEIELGFGLGAPLNQDFYYTPCEGCWVDLHELDNSKIKLSPSFLNINFGYRF